MAQVTGTYSVYDAKGLREDLSDIIYSIAPTETPFMSGIGKEKATAVLHEWQTDSLASAVATNAQIEGDEIAFAAPTATVRVNNRTQISRKSVIVSGTLDSVSKAGRNNELAYQISKASKELKRDLLLFARSNPQLFISLANDDNVQLRNVAIRAAEAGIINLSSDQRTFTWGSNGRKLMNVPFDENPYSAFAAFLKTDEGVEIYKSIDKKL